MTYIRNCKTLFSFKIFIFTYLSLFACYFIILIFFSKNVLLFNLFMIKTYKRGIAATNNLFTQPD